MNPLEVYRRRLLDRYAAIAGDLENLVKQIPQNDWYQPFNQDGWSVCRVVTHLWDWENGVFMRCLEQILNGKNAVLIDIEESAWEEKYRPHDERLDQVLMDYKSLRMRELNWLQVIPQIAWNRTGRHPRFGVRTVQWWVEQSLVHAEHHKRQLHRTYNISI